VLENGTYVFLRREALLAASYVSTSPSCVPGHLRMRAAPVGVSLVLRKQKDPVGQDLRLRASRFALARSLPLLSNAVVVFVPIAGVLLPRFTRIRGFASLVHF